MRAFILTVLFAAVPFCVVAGDEADADLNLVRVPILGGVYTVKAPSDWHLEISGDDFTATFAEEPGADGTLIISAPNPAVADIADYTRRAAKDIISAFGNGEIVQEQNEEVDGFPAHTLWFSFKADDVEFLGWGRTVDFDGVAVQAMTLSTAAKFVPYMRIAGPIFDSVELDADMVEENIDLLRAVGAKVLESLPPEQETGETPAA